MKNLEDRKWKYMTTLTDTSPHHTPTTGRTFQKINRNNLIFGRVGTLSNSADDPDSTDAAAAGDAAARSPPEVNTGHTQALGRDVTAAVAVIDVVNGVVNGVTASTEYAEANFMSPGDPAHPPVPVALLAAVAGVKSVAGLLVTTASATIMSVSVTVSGSVMTVLSEVGIGGTSSAPLSTSSAAGAL